MPSALGAITSAAPWCSSNCRGCDMAALNVQGRFDDEIERDPMAALLLSGDELLAVEPLLHRMEAARELADRARRRLSGARH